MAGRIEGFYHRLGDKPVTLEDLIEPMMESGNEFYSDILGFKLLFGIDFGYLPSLSRGSWPGWNPGSLPDVWLPGLSAGKLPSLDFGSASFPTLHPGRLPSVFFSDNVTDYILSSGKNDGTGIVVSPEKIQLEDMYRIIGKGWSQSNNLLLSLINVAIGLNRNDLVKIAASQQTGSMTWKHAWTEWKN